ncbi:MAG: hypothetical protein OXF66_03700, partial [Gammaproteobacteria bacterium]|nr:hypothetical protein [Gammaproteobacteria bacterium]
MSSSFPHGAARPPFRAAPTRTLDALCAALCLLLPVAAGAQEEKPFVAWMEPVVSVTEGDAIEITVNVRRRGEGNQVFVSTTISDDPNIDFINENKERFGEGVRLESIAPNTTKKGTIRIPTQHAAICKNGRITVSLAETDPVLNTAVEYDLDHNPANNRYGTLSIQVLDNASRCPQVTFRQNTALERDGIKEGGVFDLLLSRANDFADPVELRYRVDDDPDLDFLASGQEGEKSFSQSAVSSPSSPQRHDFSAGTVQTRFDRGRGNGAVTVTLLANDYYRLGAKTTLTVPVKHDSTLPGRELLMRDITVPESSEVVVSGNTLEGLHFPINLRGDIAASGGNPSVRVTRVASGGGCETTADALDIGSAPYQDVISWDKSNPEDRDRLLTLPLMHDEYYEPDETFCLRFDQPHSVVLPNGRDEYFATVTIENDDRASTITVDSPSAREGDSPLDFTVTLTNPPQGQDVTVRYRDNGKGTAEKDTDYEPLKAGTLTFAADAGDAPQQKTVSVQIKDDTDVEDEETVHLRFSQPANAVFTDSARRIFPVGTIIDNDSYAPELRLREAAPGAGPVVVQEGGKAVFHADLWVHKDGKWQIGAYDNRITLNWAISGAAGAAPGNGDFPASWTGSDYREAREIQIATGQTSVALEVPTRSDGTDEPTEKFEVSLRSAYELRLSGAGTDVQITRYEVATSKAKAKGEIDDGPTLRISAPAKKATEGNPLAFPVSIGVAASAEIKVRWRTRSFPGQSAEADKDYTKVVPSSRFDLVFKPGEIDKVIEVETIDDDLDEPDEDFSVVLIDPGVDGLQMGAARAAGIIRDNDKRPAVEIGDATVTEGETISLPITLNPAPAVPVRLEWRVRGTPPHPYFRTRGENIQPATRGADYTGEDGGTLTFAAGQASASLEFPTIDDEVDENTEAFQVVLLRLREGEDPLFFTSQRSSQQTDILAPLTATVTILDNDTPSMWIEDFEVTEGEKQQVNFTVRLSSARTYPVEFRYKTEDGGGPEVPIIFGGTQFRTHDAKGSGPARDYIDTTKAPGFPLQDGWAEGEFPAGITRAIMYNIEIVDDDRQEYHSEYFSGIISLKPGTDPDKVVITKDVGLAKIRDNDTTRYRIVNKDTNIPEGQSARIRVKRDRTGLAVQGLFGCIEPTGPYDQRDVHHGHAGTIKRTSPTPRNQIDVFTIEKDNVASACGQANDGSQTASFEFGENEDESSFWVRTVDDNREEPDETFIVWIDGVVHSSSNEAETTDHLEIQKVFTIIDDDDIYRFRVVSANSPWEGEPAHFDIYVDSDQALAALQASSSPFTLARFGAETDTAMQGVHYQPPSNRLNFEPSSATDKTEPVGRITIDTISNNTLDGNKTFTISFSEIFEDLSTSLPFRPLPGGDTATATIRDDEAVHLSVLDTVSDEGELAGVTVRLSKAASRGFTIRFRTKAGTAKGGTPKPGTITVEPPADFAQCAAKDDSCALFIREGVVEAEFFVLTTEDDVPEETEQFKVIIDDIDYADVIVERRAAAVKIRDDDGRSVAIAGLADVSVPENSDWTSPAPSWEGTPDGDVAWTLEGDDAEHFAINPDTGVVTLAKDKQDKTITFNFEAPIDTNTDNVYEFTVRVTDEDGNSATAPLSLTVTDIVYGSISAAFPAPANGRIQVNEGDPVAGSFRYVATGARGGATGRPDEVRLRWKIVGLGVAGAAAADEVIESKLNGSGPYDLQYAASAASDVELAETVEDDFQEEPLETFGIELRTNSDDVVFYDPVSETTGGNCGSGTCVLLRNFAIVEDDSRGVTVTPTSLPLAEADDPDTADNDERIGEYTVVLNSQPTAGRVVITVESGDETVATVSPGNLRFTKDTWNDPQTVTVTAADDSLDNIDDARATSITHSLAARGDGNDYDGITVDAVALTVADDDDAPTGIALSTAPSTVAENAATAATVTVTATVTGGTTYGAETTVTVTVGDSDDTATSGEDYAAVTSFDIDIPAGATSATATFSLDPTDDAIAEGSEKLTVSGASGDIDVESAEVTIADNEGTPTATLVLTPTAINESGNGNVSTVTATLSPASSKDLTLTVSAGTGVTLSDNKVLTIDAGETESEGVVTLTAVNNDVDTADLRVTVSAAASGGNGVANPADQTLTVRDDDARGVTVAPKTLTVRETDDSTTNGDN